VPTKKKPRKANTPDSSGLPSRDELRRFIREAPGRVGKREISRAFNLGPADRGALRALLKSLAAEGAVAPAGHRRFSAPDRLADAIVVQITGTDPDGDAIARPVSWAPSRTGERPPLILMAPEPRGRPALAPGERVLARLKPIGPGKYEGRTIKRLGDTPVTVLGVYRVGPEGPRIVPTDRRAKAEWLVLPGDEGGAEPGEIVRAEPVPGNRFGLKPARIVERLGRLGDARSVSLICIHTHDIPQEFSSAALEQAAAAHGVGLDGREDIRPVPLVTIDGEDARDFDDAVFAEPDGTGFRLIVAIADVAHYVRPDSPLDRDAKKRGNSVYFPDRVVPMLPEALSNGWCSLRPDEDRGCLFVEMRIDAAGGKIAHRFGRGLMRSTARLTYEQVQEAHNADPVQHAALYAAFRALLAARRARGTLDLDLPERRVVLNEAGEVIAVTPRPRLDSHRLIEEFMVLANVAAAEELEKRHLPCMYRVHAPPSGEKLDALRGFLSGFGISLPPGDQVHPRDLERVLNQVAGTEAAPLVNETMLRSQSQAEYSPDNIGHFGLALSRYAHFTSPIRRYADLIVHRALLGELPAGTALTDVAEHITATERRAQLAERDAIDRYLVAFMQSHVGARFAGRISGVTRFALFVTLDSGASGIVPLSTLQDDFWVHDERAQTLTGRRTGVTWRLGQAVETRLMEASPITGGLLFNIISDAATARPAPRGGKFGGGRRRSSPT
jgi:ribonuclease R